MDPRPEQPRDPVLWCGLIVLLFFGLVQVRLGIPSKPFFDEVHYLPPARTLLELSRVLNKEHPLAGKEAIALSIALFGDNPVGWRMMSALGGSVALFGFMRAMWFASMSRFAAIATGVLIATNFLLFIHSRIAMLDMTMICFTSVALWMCAGAVREPRNARWRLIVAGVSFGIAMGAKWNAVPVAALPGLTFLAMRIQSARWSFLTSRHGAPVPGMTLAEAALWLGVLPLLTYAATFLPLLFFHEGAMKPGIAAFFEWHVKMIKMQDSVVRPHPYMSVWWQWVIDWRPIWYLYEKVDGAQRGVLLLGNPLTMILGLPALAWCAWTGADKKNWTAIALLLLYTVSLGMWIVSGKPIQFYYHYMLPSCFLMGALALALDRFWQKGNRWLPLLVLAAACGLFAFYYPILSAAELPDSQAYLKWMWLRSWH
jgi:dolichyl-phosphate-mannose-protein mannosyltransferase